MADQTTTVPMDDRELFQSAMADEPVVQQEAPVEQSDAKPDATEQPRDDQGRFAPKQATATEAAPTQQQAPAEQQATTSTTESKDDAGGQVPSWRLREVNEARQTAERRAEEAGRQAYALQSQLQQMQRQIADLTKPKQEPVDFFSDPDAALAQKLSPVEERFARLETQVRLNSSRAVAIAMHGAQAVSEMEGAVEKASRENHPDLPHLAAQMRASDDPVNVAMQWHKRTKLWDMTGGDPDAFRQKTRDELLKDPQFLAQAVEVARAQAGGAPQSNARPNIQLPPSLSKAPGAGVSNTPDDGDMSSAALFRHAMSAPRR